MEMDDERANSIVASMEIVLYSCHYGASSQQWPVCSSFSTVASMESFLYNEQYGANSLQSPE